MTESKSTPSPDDFSRLIGSALTMWAQVEYAHCCIFQTVASGVLGNGALMKAYWAVISFEARQKMVDAAVRETVSGHDEYLRIWTNLNNRLIRKNKIRNKLAHGTIVPTFESGQLVDVYFAPYFFPNIGKYILETALNDERLSDHDITSVIESFSALNQDLLSFFERYDREQILSRSQVMPDGTREAPRFHRPTPPPQIDDAQS
ncbi:MAG: hypothetical protein RIA09_04510 [Hoeflea sp.]|uniref:hypothetical protein n=1 Tax=Hoeflea sp. TaxID=1940281 RepID=UPI0032EFE169